MAIEITKEIPWHWVCAKCKNPATGNADYEIRISLKQIILCHEHLAELAQAIKEALDEEV